MRFDYCDPRVAIFVDNAGSYGRGVIQGIAKYLETHGPWSLYIETHATGVVDVRWLRRWKGDGLLAFIEHRPVVAKLQRLGIPTVEVYGHLPELQLPSVQNDDNAIGRLAAEHFLDNGFKHFAFTGYRHQRWSILREQGFVSTAGQAGFSCAVKMYPRHSTATTEWETAQVKLAEWLASLPIPLGVMACSDRHAQNVLDACRRAERIVPEEVAVIGADNDPTICRLSNPPISSVEDNPEKIGYLAANVLDQLIMGKGNHNLMEPILVAPRGVVPRRSTDVTITEDSEVSAALTYIRKRACQPVNANDVLRQVSLSRSAFFPRFRKVVGRTIHQEILRIRMGRAKYLLTQTTLPLAQVSHLTGFDSPEYFGVAFKREIGQTPGQFRSDFSRAGSAKAD